ncbi:GFA family protein [Roseivivax sp. CAU 1753]
MASKTGHCLCGAVQFTLAEAPTEYGACHCTMCRRWSGGIELGIEALPDAIAWSGEDNIQTYQSSEWAERGWCRTCGTNLFWRLTAPGPMHGMLALSCGALDDASGMTFAQEVYIDHKLDSHAFAGTRKRLTEADINAMVAAMQESPSE